MKQSINIAVILSIAFVTGIVCSLVLPTQQPIPKQQVAPVADHSSQVISADYEVGRDDGSIQLCQCQGCESPQAGLIHNGRPAKFFQGVDDSTPRLENFEPRWRKGSEVPFEEFGYGEWVGPHRTPHVDEYRLRVGDDLEFVYVRTREKSLHPYQMYVGDTIEVSSAIDESLNQVDLIIRSDGKTTFAVLGEIMCAGKTVEGLQRELNDRYTEFVREPSLSLIHI